MGGSSFVGSSSQDISELTVLLRKSSSSESGDLACTLAGPSSLGDGLSTFLLRSSAGLFSRIVSGVDLFEILMVLGDVLVWLVVLLMKFDPSSESNWIRLCGVVLCFGDEVRLCGELWGFGNSVGLCGGPAGRIHFGWLLSVELSSLSATGGTGDHHWDDRPHSSHTWMG